jgi:hypothetical protein
LRSVLSSCRLLVARYGGRLHHIETKLEVSFVGKACVLQCNHSNTPNLPSPIQYLQHTQSDPASAPPPLNHPSRSYPSHLFFLSSDASSPFKNVPISGLSFTGVHPIPGFPLLSHFVVVPCHAGRFPRRCAKPVSITSSSSQSAFLAAFSDSRASSTALVVTLAA